MADDLNSLLQAQHSSSVLQGIMNPAQVNPLAAMDNSGISAASGVYDLRQKQALEAAGQAFQASIDPATGQPRQSVFNQNLAANPRAAMAALAASGQGQVLDNNTLNTHLTRLSAGNAAAMALTAQYPNGVPPDAWHAEIDRVGPTLGWSPTDIAQAHASVTSDPVQNTRTIIRNGMINLSAQEALHATRPGTATIDSGQGVSGAQVAPAASDVPGTLTTVGTETPTGYPSREKLLEQVGQPITDPAEAKALGVPVGTIRTAPMVLRYQQQNVPPTLTGPAGQVAKPVAPGTKPAAPVPSPIPGGGVYKPPGAAAPAATPAAPAPAAPAPAAPAAPAPASTDTTMKPVVTSLPPGADKDVEAFKTDQGLVDSRKTTDRNLMHAYDALKLTTSGKSTETTHALFNYLQAGGLLPAGATDELKNYELFRKYTEKNIADLGNAAGTDAGRSLAAQSNAGTSLSTPTNLEVIRNDTAQNRQKIAATMAEKPENGGIGYLDRRGAVANNTDPRGFVWSMYTDAERTKILKEVGKPGSAADLALHRAIGMAQTFHLDKPIPPPTPQKQSFNAMPPQQNALLSA